MSISKEIEEYARWEGALDELINLIDISEFEAQISVNIIDKSNRKVSISPILQSVINGVASSYISAILVSAENSLTIEARNRAKRAKAAAQNIIERADAPARGEKQ